MQIFTSYFSKISKLPKEIVPVSVSLYPPKGFHGYRYSKLAPTRAILSSWKANQDENAYEAAYARDVLSKLNAKELASNLERYFAGRDVCFVCYEKPGAFCHRHLIAEWFRENNIECREWQNEAEQFSLFSEGEKTYE